MLTTSLAARSAESEEPDEYFEIDDPYPSDDDPLPAPEPLRAAAAEAALPVDENGSSLRALWDGLLGSLIGLIFSPSLAYGLRLLIAHFGHAAVLPLPLWSSGLLILILLQAGLCVLLRRISAMCAISFAVCAFFCLIPAVAILSQLTSMRMPL